MKPQFPVWVAVVFMLPACHPVTETMQDYQPPQMEMEDLVSYYPLEAYLKGIEGRVVVLVHIEGSGEVSDVRVTVSSGEAMLDSAAQNIARVIRFTPGLVRGQPQALWLKLPIVFTLDQLDRSPINLQNWQRKALELQTAVTAGGAEERRIAERELLDHYVRLAYELVNGQETAANRIILKVAEESVRNQWENYAQVWPLPFVLFQDFLLRCSHSMYAGLARQYYRDYLRYEISLLGKAPSIGPAAREERQKLLEVLRKHLGEEPGG